jgi:isopropylmalate/homocitrate/citramalate synthase
MRHDIILEDTTLRDGEQSPGMAFSKEAKLRLHDELVEAGVRWIEAGIPAMGGDELSYMRELLARGSNAMLIGWNRGVRADVEQSLDLGFPGIHIGLPASKQHLGDSVRRDRSWLLRTAAELVGLGKDRGAFVSISAEDVGRTEIDFLVEYACCVHEAGADRLRLSDTIGILTPEGYAERVGAIVAQCPIDLQCHAHNDFGLGVANTIAGLRAGARYFHVTINGIGERAGMPDLAQAVMALKALYDRDVGVDTSRLYRLSRALRDVVGREIPPWQPVVGDNVFAHESGIHVNAMLRNASSFEPLHPGDVGGMRRYVLGKHSGRAIVRATLTAQGIEPHEEKLGPCLDRVRELAVQRGGAVEPDELGQIYADVAGV